MRNFKTTFTLFSLIVILGLSISCDHYHHEENIITSTDLLAGRSDDGKIWRITSIELEGLGRIEPFECLQDNNITYYPSGRYEVNEGISKCDPEAPPAFLGSWELNRSESILTIQIEDSIAVWDITYLREDVHPISRRFYEGERTYILQRF